MNLLYRLACLLSFLAIFFFSCSPDTSRLSIEHDLGKGYYLKSLESNWQSDYFDYLSDTTYMAIAAGKNNKFGAINRQGEEVVPFEYEFTEVYPNFIIAHDFPNLVELHAYISVFDHKGSKFFTKLLRKCIPMNEHLIYGDLSNKEAYILNPLGATIHEALPHPVKEVWPGIFEFKNREGELAYLDAKGNLIDRPKYVPLYKTHDQFEKSDYVAATNEQEQKLLVSKDQETVIDIPKPLKGSSQSYEVVDVQYNYAILKRDTYYHEIYDINNAQVLDSTLSREFIKVKVCPNGKVFFNNIFRNRQYKYVGTNNEILMTSKQGMPLTDEAQPILIDICSGAPKEYKIEGDRRSYSKEFRYYHGNGEENYFQNSDNTIVYPSKEWSLKRLNGISNYDLYSIVKNQEEQYGLIDENFEVVLPLAYDDIMRAGVFNNTFYIIKDGKKGMSDAYGNVTIAPEYDEFIPLWGYYKLHGIIIARKESNYYLLNFSGTRLNDQVYTSFEKKHGVIYPLKYFLSNDQETLQIDAVGRIKRK
jgi:hypothetical protein